MASPETSAGLSHPWRQLADDYVEKRSREILRLKPGDPFNPSDMSPGEMADLLSSSVGGSGVSPEVLETVRSPSTGDIEAWRELLLDVPRMQFVKVLFLEARTAPTELTLELARAAVYTVNPSFNKHFLEQIVPRNPQGVYEALRGFLKQGNAWEFAGACDALYWIGRYLPQGTKLVHGAEGGLVCLKRFVHEDDVCLRRSLMSEIGWRQKGLSEEASQLLRKAHEIASQHEDPYIRDRYAYETGATKLIPALPHRPVDPPGE